MTKPMLWFVGRGSVGSAQAGAGRLDIVRGRFRQWLGRQLNRHGVPGAVAPSEYTDALTGLHLRIDVTELYTRIQIDGRDFFFDRLTGRLDGTGQGCG